ncbi:MAG TPA: CocE/NonD family hydrolase, partial [Gemmataceae bacterium]|nr:CocE/NonD family hydrolase [Gemmataceae bacterium]
MTRPSLPLLSLGVALALTATGDARGDELFEVVVRKGQTITARDGTKLAADIYLPAKNGSAIEGRHPTLLTRTPYGKGRAGEIDAGRWFAARGYAVVVNDCRGRFASEGRWRMLLDDPDDGADVVKWIVTQPWSTGKIGTFGTSYVGGTQHALACANPPGLACMIPVDSVSNAGIAGIRHSGAFELRFFNWAFNNGGTTSREALANPALKDALAREAQLVPQHLLRLPVRPGSTPLKHVPDAEAWLVEVMRHGDYDAYWKQPGYSVIDNVERYADVPVYHVTGWYDSWCRQNVMNWQALSQAKMSPQRLIVGPWTHGSQTRPFAGEIEFPPEAALEFNEWRLRWFDRWVRGVENGVERDGPVRIFVMGGGDGRKSKDGRLRHGGRWREEAAFPLERTKFTPYYLHADGKLGPVPPATLASTTFRFDPNHPVPSIGGNISSFAGILEPGGFDQRCRRDTPFATDTLPLSERRDVLVFQTDPLPEDMEVTGPITVNLFVSSSAVDTDFTAKLIDVYPASADFAVGFDLNIGDGIARARFRESLDKEVLMTPGEIYPLTVKLYPTSNVFKRGHRIRVDISSSNFPRFDVNPNTGEPLNNNRTRKVATNTVYHDARHPSAIILPVVPAAKGNPVPSG